MIIWEGKPERRPFLLKGVLCFFNSILFLAFSWGLFIAISKVCKSDLNWAMMYLIAFLIIGDGLFREGRKILGYSKTFYYVTNRMIYIQSGVFMRKMTAFERSKIVFIDIVGSNIDKKFNVRTISIHFGEIKLTDGKEEKIFQKLEFIKNPEAIVKLLP